MHSQCLDSLLNSIKTAGAEARKAAESVDEKLSDAIDSERGFVQSDESLHVSAEALSGKAAVASETLFL